MANSFPKERRLTRKQDIDAVFKHGKTVSCPGLRLIVRRNGRTFNRIAISPTRKFRTAVSRNRVRRVLRETFRRHQHVIAPGYDLAVVVYPGDYTGNDRARQLKRLLHTAGLIADKNRSEP